MAELPDHLLLSSLFRGDLAPISASQMRSGIAPITQKLAICYNGERVASPLFGSMGKIPGAPSREIGGSERRSRHDRAKKGPFSQSARR